MTTAFVTVRGQKYLVRYHDHGYERDTNTRDVDWSFVDTPGPETDDDEDDDIYNQLCMTADEL